MPKVSVIIPCYNAGRYIEDAVESVLAQTFEDFEIIITDDGSTDPMTIELLRDYKRPRTRVLHTENGGPSHARNVGIREARGRYMLPLDADDMIGKEYLQKAVEILDNDPSIGIVYCEAEFFCDHDSSRTRWDLPPYSLENLLVRVIIHNSSFFRRSDWERTGGYDEAMIHGDEDYDFWLRLVETGVGVHKLPEVLYYHRLLQDSRSYTFLRSEEKLIHAAERIYFNHQKLFAENQRVLIAHRIRVERELARIKHDKVLGVLNKLHLYNTLGHIVDTGHAFLRMWRGLCRKKMHRGGVEETGKMMSCGAILQGKQESSG
jgi:glycosyltransferase involved in cell wall biosynthesis